MVAVKIIVPGLREGTRVILRINETIFPLVLSTNSGLSVPRSIRPGDSRTMSLLPASFVKVS